MAKIAKQLTELIGNTPLVELNKFSKSKGIDTPLIAKVEFFNPGGSVKDRIALAMVEQGIDNSQGAIYYEASTNSSQSWHCQNREFLFEAYGQRYYK